jgi:hypothetical protein
MCVLSVCQPQDALPGNTGRGIWITYSVWSTVMKQLKMQASELVQWERLLTSSQQQLGLAQNAVEVLEDTVIGVRQQAQDQVRPGGVKQALGTQ